MKDIKNQIEDLLKATGRRGIEDLLVWMDENGFYNAPCSSKFHLAEPGGLAKHSLNVFKNAMSMINGLYLDQGKILSFDLCTSATICALLHDLGKAGQYGKPNYIYNDDLPFGGEYHTNKELLYIPHEVRSIAIASRFIELTEEEQFAILYHNGLYGELQSIKNHETELYMILHFADMWACRVTEK